MYKINEWTKSKKDGYKFLIERHKNQQYLEYATFNNEVFMAIMYINCQFDIDLIKSEKQIYSNLCGLFQNLLINKKHIIISEKLRGRNNEENGYLYKVNVFFRMNMPSADMMIQLKEIIKNSFLKK